MGELTKMKCTACRGGKPMAQLLLQENATVTICHSRTRKLTEVAARGDILVVALGRREMIGAEYV